MRQINGRYFSCKVSKRVRNGTGQRIPVKVKAFKIRKRSKLWRDRATKIIVGQIEGGQARELAEKRRNRTREIGPTNCKCFEMGELGDRRGYLAREVGKFTED